MLTVEDLDWTFVSPAAFIHPGERTGRYRVGGDQLLVDDNGNSEVSAEDYAIAIADLLEQGGRERERITVASKPTQLARRGSTRKQHGRTLARMAPSAWSACLGDSLGHVRIGRPTDSASRADLRELAGRSFRVIAPDSPDTEPAGGTAGWQSHNLERRTCP